MLCVNLYLSCTFIFLILASLLLLPPKYISLLLVLLKL